MIHLTLLLLYTLTETMKTPASGQSQVQVDIPQDFRLPSSLYFLHDRQIWTISSNLKEMKQITHEMNDVDFFDVSPVTGELIYTTGNSMVLSDASGGNRKVVIEGPVDSNKSEDLKNLNEREFIENVIRTPVWAPKNRQIAFIQNGLRIVDLVSGAVRLEHGNGEAQQPIAGQTMITSVLGWSPDGSSIIVQAYDYPIKSLYNQKLCIKKISGSLTMLLEGKHPTFCWSQDGSLLVIANSETGGSGSLIRYSAADGVLVHIGQDVPARASYFHSHPKFRLENKLNVFLAISRSPVDVPDEFTLYEIQATGYGAREIRSDRFSIETALWEIDGRGVVVVTATSSRNFPPGSVLWVPSQDGQMKRLNIPSCRMLRWGIDR